MAVTLGDPPCCRGQHSAPAGWRRKQPQTCTQLRQKYSAMLSVSFQGGTAAGQNSFTHLLIQQFFAEYLLCARHRYKQNKSSSGPCGNVYSSRGRPATNKGKRQGHLRGRSAQTNSEARC